MKGLQIIKNQMKGIAVVALLMLMLLHTGCYYDVESELYPTTECLTQDMSYQVDIVPIIKQNCYACHDAANNFAGITLEGHGNLKRYVENGELLSVVQHVTGFSPMPKNAAKLLDCEIEKIEAWIEKGAPDN